MNLFDKIAAKTKELKEKTEDRIRANGGFEGILQKTSEKVDQLTDSASEGLKKATQETKQYIQEAKNTAQEQGQEGFIGVAKTLGVKVGTDVSSLVRSGYQKIAQSEAVQNLKKEFKEADERQTAENPSEPAVDLSGVKLEHIFKYFFSGVQSGDNWTTSSQEGNPKNERLIKLTYVVNGEDWYNTQTNESGSGAFDLTLDYLSNQTKLSLTDPENSRQLVSKTRTMLITLVSQLHSLEEQEKAEKANKEEKKVSTVKKAPVKKVSHKVEKSSEEKTPTPATKKPAVKTSNKKTTESKDADSVTKTSTPAKKPAAKKSAVKKAPVKNAEPPKKENE